MRKANLKGRRAVRWAVDDDPRRLLADLGVRPRRAMGQHFLIDPRVAARQVAHAQIRRSDVVLEIGPGLGVLTRLLAEKAKRVVAIEADRRFAEYLRHTLPDGDVIAGDALKVDWPSFDVMASNLPYQISSPLTFRLLECAFRRAVLMYQWGCARSRGHPTTQGLPWACTDGRHARSWSGSLGTHSILSHVSIPPSSPSCRGQPPFPCPIPSVSTPSWTLCSCIDGRRSRMAFGSRGKPSLHRPKCSRRSCPRSPIAPVGSGNCRRRRARASPTPWRCRKVNGTSVNRYSPS